VPFPLRVDEIQIEGLLRTQSSVVRRELGVTEGDMLTSSALALAKARLWNTSLFSRVELSVTSSQGRNVLLVQVEDRWTLNPLFRFGSGGNAAFFRVGAADNNLAGQFLEAQAQYEYFDGFHGGQVLFRQPRLFDKRLELTLQVDRLVRPREGFSDQRTQGIIELAHLFLGDHIRAGVRASAFADRFLAPVSGSAPYYPSPTATLLVEPSLRVGRIDVIRLRQRGTSFEVRPGLGFLDGTDVPSRYASITAEWLGFALLGNRWNVASRVRGAGVSAVPAHLEGYAGGLDLVRGFPDNFARSRALAVLNLELRAVAFDSTWFALVPAVFTDALVARAPAGDPGTALSFGGGVRLLVPKFVGTGLRLDLAVPVHADLRAVREADHGRFGPTTPAVTLGGISPSIGVYQFF
jgi:hypothetical protein